MYTRLFFAALMSMLLAWPSLADDQPAGNGAPKQNEKKDDKKPEKKEKRETYRHMGQLSGTIKDVSDVGRTITLEMRGAVPNFIPTHYWRGMIRGSYRVQQQSYDMDLVLADDVKVRLPAKPEYDEKGRPKKAKPDPEDKGSNRGGSKGGDSGLD
ncbi:MAG TPA: hypothetical protein PKC45_18295 [Gemmatales bacterium]|nr:hypothetical protein [Gemmatales bacterium]